MSVERQSAENLGRIPLAIRSLTFYWRAHVAVLLGVAVAGAVLTGALLVGDSMRSSLRDVALRRLSGVDYALVAPSFFRQALADDLDTLPAFASSFGSAVPAIVLKAGLTHSETGALIRDVNLWGVDKRFWKRSDKPSNDDPTADLGRDLLVNEPLAREIGIKPGQDVLIRMGASAAISPEMLFGRSESAVLTRRVTVRAVLPAEGMGQFALSTTQREPLNAYMSLTQMQRWLDQHGRVNALLVGRGSAEDPPRSTDTPDLQQLLDSQLKLDDLGLRLRLDHARGFMSLESETFLIPPAVEEAVRHVGEQQGLRVGSVLSTLAISIKAGDASPDGRPNAIPYSVVTALDPGALAISRLTLIDGSAVGRIAPGEILLNSWASNDLGVSGQQDVTLSFFVTAEFGQLETRQAGFRLRGVVDLSGGAADPGYTPDYPGVTDTENMGDWDPPFPVDMSRIRDVDEEYWRQHRTTPKAFVGLADGLEMWATQGSRFGRLTAMRLGARRLGAMRLDGGPDQSLDSLAARFESALVDHLGGRPLGRTFTALREQALQAATGSTDFAGLFIGFSIFLMFSAAMLVVLMFRLGVERRAAEVGILLAVGYSRLQVAKMFLIEGSVVVLAGTLLGFVGSTAYAGFMLAGLRSWWSDAVNAPFVKLYVSSSSLMIGGAGTVLVALVSIMAGLHGLRKFSACGLLAGRFDESSAMRGRDRRAAGSWTFALPAGLAGIAAALPSFVATASPEIFFFVSGALLLLACLIFVRRCLRTPARGMITRPGTVAILSLGVRNAARHPGRSTQTIALIASAVFIIVTVQAFRIEVKGSDSSRSGGTGGFALVAESAVPILFDLNTSAGQEALGITDSASAALGEAFVIPFRLRPGDDSSCRNLYRPTQYRIIGATDEMIQRGGFGFAAVLKSGTDAELRPWRMLLKRFDDGAIPVIGDESAVKWQLHSGLGQDLAIRDESGRSRILRFVALLKNSMLQDELILAESDFISLFPSRDGYSFFLISAPQEKIAEVSNVLELELARFGFDARSASERLAGYVAVQNTYLSIFQALGGLGLILGTVGLAAVLLRNVWERRSELALMRAVGFGRPALGAMVLAENAMLVIAGILAGLIPALVAMTPHIIQRPRAIPWFSIVLILAAVFVVAMISAALAVMPTLRARLLPSLRRE
ncbi:MAG: ABC transporter permease [Planctomycetes bacterium]|nr:ABC transporter permease [Planctomycetota bacterium]